MTNEQIEQALAVCEKRTPGKWSPETFVDLWQIYDQHGSLINNARDNRTFVAATTDPDTGYEAALRDLREARAECDRRAVRIDDWLHSYNRASREADQLRAQLRKTVIVLQDLLHQVGGHHDGDCGEDDTCRCPRGLAGGVIIAHADLLTEEKP